MTFLGVGFNVAAWELSGGMDILAGVVHEIVISVNSVTGPGQLNVQVSAVPVPAALFLFAAALLGFLGLRRKAALAA